MEFYIVAFILLGLIVYGFNDSFKLIGESDRALVERLGIYRRTLQPGVRFVWPLIEKLAYTDTVREQLLDIKPQEFVTNDSITLKVDAMVYWRIVDLRKVHYDIDDITKSISSIVLTTLGDEIRRLTVQQILSAKEDIDRALSRRLDEVTGSWGVKIIRVEVQRIIFPQDVKETMEKEWAVLRENETKLARAQAEKQAVLANAEAEAETIELLAKALNADPNSREFLGFLVAIRYVAANQKLGESANSKILFLDPKLMSESLQILMEGRPEVDDITKSLSSSPPFNLNKNNSVDI